MWLLSKSIQYAVIVRMWSLPLSLLFQNMLVWKRSSLVVGNRKLKQPTQQSPDPPTTVEQSFQGAEICWAWCPCQGVTTTPNPAASMATEGTKCQLMATSHRDTNTRWEPSQVVCGIYLRWYQIPAMQVDVMEKSHTRWKVASTTKRQQVWT